MGSYLVGLCYSGLLQSFPQLNMNYWLSILHVREYESDEKRTEEKSSPSRSDLPSPRWDLVVVLKQLLRKHHRVRSTLHPPQPSTMGFTDKPDLRKAGVIPLNISEIKQRSKELVGV